MEFNFNLQINKSSMTAEDVQDIMIEIMNDHLDHKNEFRRKDLLTYENFINLGRVVKCKWADNTYTFTFSPRPNTFYHDFMSTISVLVAKLETYTEFDFVS